MIWIKNTFGSIDRLKADPVWGKFRFKRLDKGCYINSNISIKHELIDVVNFTVFVRIEEDRFPLFFGPSFFYDKFRKSLP